MSTVGKAISLLELLGAAGAETPLADLAGRAGFDKATTRRLLVSLIEHGLVDQDETTRLYRLGAGVARLALMREAQFPFRRAGAPQVERLAEESGETAHLSEYSPQGLVSVHVVESTKANRVSLPVGAILPLHATASGIAFLALAEERVRAAALAQPFPSFTRHTLASAEALAAQITAAQARGYSIGWQGFEDGVESVAAAIAGPRGFAIGAIAIAAPHTRVQKGELKRYGRLVMEAARVVGDRLAGRDRPSAQEQAS
jgi:DNA-binding IclR family transcriptional regulator